MPDFRPRLLLTSLILLAAGACGGVSSSDLTGAWISTDTTSRVEFFQDGRATMSDPLNTITATWTRADGAASLAIADTSGAPLQIAIEKSDDLLVLRVETDTVRYQRASPVLESAFSRISGNEAVAAMSGELLALREAQGTVHQLAKSYSKTMPLDYQPSNSVEIVITEASATAWSATATHPATKTKCAISVGGMGNGLVSCN